MNPKVSVVVPTHNRPDLIKKAINSILAQTFKDLEIIVVDDGLEKRSDKAVSDFGDARIKYFQHKINKGGAAARNTGISEARGEFIAFLDDDDEWSRDKLEMQINLLESSPGDVGFCFSAIEQVFDDRTQVSQVPEGIKDYHELALMRFNGFMTSTLVIRKKVLEELGLFDESFPSHQEPDLIIRITKKYRGVGINRALIKMNVSSSNDSVGKNISKRIEGRRLILKKHHKEFKERPKILAKHIFQLAIWYRDAGQRDGAKKYFNLAWKTHYYWRYLFHWLRAILMA